MINWSVTYSYESSKISKENWWWIMSAYEERDQKWESLDDVKESQQKVKTQERKTAAEGAHSWRKWEEVVAKRKNMEQQE